MHYPILHFILHYALYIMHSSLYYALCIQQGNRIKSGILYFLSPLSILLVSYFYLIFISLFHSLRPVLLLSAPQP